MQYSKNYKIPKPELNDTVNITNIHEIIDKFDTLTKDVDINCSNIKTNEDTRVSNENKRIEAESIRTSSESDRNSNEQLRKADELNRVNKETKRISDEQIRVSNEQNRISAESDRVLKENERLTNEQTRQENETTRTTNESKRVTNESYREETFKRMEEIFDLKAPGDMSKVEYDKDNDGIIDEAKHALEADKATESTHALSSDVSNSVEWNNVQNRPDVAKIEEQLKDNTTKTITKETNMLSIADNVEGIANITLEGNTVDIVKEPIISDFQGKVAGSTNKNPNIAKYGYSKQLLNPSEFTSELNDGYSKINTKDDACVTTTAIANSVSIPQMLFSFNLIAIVENKIGTIPGSSTTDKVVWLKKNVKAMTCDWYGYGSCPSGNKAYLDAWDNTYNRWNMERQGIQDGMSNNFNSPHIISYNTKSLDYLTSDGFIHFLAYTDASDGTTPSVIYTDYINLEVQLNPILKSVGEQENNKFEVKSVGKNLFDKTKIQKGRLSITNGEICHILSNHEGYSSFPLILVKENTKMTIQGNAVFIVLCDKDKRVTRYVSVSAFDGTRIGEYYVGFYTLSYDDDLSNVQLEEGITATQHEDYKEDKVTINLLEPLKGLPNSVRDTINADGAITRRVGKVVLNGSEDWSVANNDSENTKTFKNIINGLKDTGNVSGKNSIIVDTFPLEHSWEDKEHIHANDNTINITIAKNKLSTQDTEGFKQWLKKNPITVYYELTKPTTESIGQPLNLKTFENGHIVIDTEITPFITVEYPSNLNSRINTVEDAASSIKDNLGGAWQTLLILADKELKMKSITPLSTSDDISKKINEIIGVW